MADHQEVLTRSLHPAAHGRLHSAPQVDADDRDPEEGNMLVSPAFWIAGGLCLLTWISLAAYFASP